ncbi:hypothetical protein [Acinetobacter pittii]|uniref:hypothetical protein n=1 Tax=Acinetobacter pittii TaxID=48296 RepID=UPI0032F06D60
MQKNNKWCIGAVLLLSLMAQVSYAEKDISTQPFENIKASQQDIDLICKQLRQKCSGEAILWKGKNTQDPVYYLIDESPQIVQVKKQNNQYKVVDQWDFKDYQYNNKEPHTDDLAPDGLQIFPALYPLNKNEFAIAVVNKWFTGYSGGGRFEENADFIKLKPHGKYQVALKDIAFSSREMIRACFSEQDYKKSPHCHDEAWMILNIQFKDVGQPYYLWQLNYKNYSWEAFKSKKTITIEQSREEVMPFKK